MYSISKTDIYFEDSTSNELGFLHCLTQYETIEQLVFIGLRVWSKSQYCLLALMGHIVYSLYKNRSGLVVEEFIPCSHCFRSIDSEEGEGERKEITRFPVLEVINGLQDERECVFCGEVMVRLSDLAPDILFKDLDEFKVLNVEKSQLLGYDLLYLLYFILFFFLFLPFFFLSYSNIQIQEKEEKEKFIKQYSTTKKKWH